MARRGRVPLSRLRAVCFDLFGTLVEEFRHDAWDRWYRETAAALGVDEAAFREGWRATSIDRQTGRLGDIEGNLRVICDRAEVRPSAESLRRALGIRRRFYEDAWRTVPGAAETLRGVRDRGLRSAVVSMCAPDTPPLFRASELAALVDVEVFSCQVGLRKPDLAIYRLACERLGVPPRHCLYAGDGSYGELSGARAVGMRAVLVRDPAEPAGRYHRPEEEAWDGPSVGSLPEVLGLLDAG